MRRRVKQEEDCWVDAVDGEVCEAQEVLLLPEGQMAEWHAAVIPRPFVGSSCLCCRLYSLGPGSRTSFEPTTSKGSSKGKQPHQKCPMVSRVLVSGSSASVAPCPTPCCMGETSQVRVEFSCTSWENYCTYGTAAGGRRLWRDSRKLPSAARL